MTRMLKVIACFIFAAMVTFAAHGQSVADAARQSSKAQKSKASKTYTNEDIPSVAEPTAAAPKKEADAAESKDSKSSTAAEAAPAKEDEAAKDASKDTSKDKAADAKSAEKEWKDKVSAQKEKIAGLEKEKELAEREQKLRAAVFYADAGNRLRNDKKWAEAELKYKDDMAKLDTDIKASKEQLETMQEQARKAGVKVD